MTKGMNIYNLFGSLIVLIIGVILMTNPDALIGTVSWIIGSLLIIAGIIKSIMSYKDNTLYTSSLYIGIIIIIVGIFLISFPEIINITIKILFGGWILFAGVQRSVLAMTLKEFNQKVSNTFLISSLIMIVIGILVLINFYNLLGLLLIIYAVIEIIDYIYYTSKNITTGKKSNKKSNKTKKKKVSKNIKNKEAVDADIEE